MNALDSRKALVQFSTGVTSAEVAYYAVQKHGPENTVLLAADTLVEDEDNWRFAAEVSDYLGVSITRIADGRTPMQVGRDERVIPNNRMAVCSKILKRELLRKYMDTHYDPANSVVYLGFGWDEERRLKDAQPFWAPWTMEAPLLEPQYLGVNTKKLWRDRGIEPPRLYAMGFGHANCGGACVRGGQEQWALLLKVNRLRYLEWEAEERLSRELLGDYSILRDRSRSRIMERLGLTDDDVEFRFEMVGARRRRVYYVKATGEPLPTTLPLSLARFRGRLENNPEAYDHEDIGSACACSDVFLGDPDDFNPGRSPEQLVLVETDSLMRRVRTAGQEGDAA